MTVFAADILDNELKAARRDLVLVTMAITIGASGAVSSTEVDDPACSATKDAGAGEYDLTFPKSVGGRFWVQIVSPAGTVRSSVATAAPSYTGGTVTITTYNEGGAGADVATNPASGDIIYVFFLLQKRSTT